ncbi:hypothetical protein SMG44B_100089 [Stenotrophomonas maltophilia]
MGSALQKAANQPAFAFAFASAFLFSFPWRTHSEIVRGRAGWVRGGVRGMDAAAKPPLTG